MTQPLPMSGRAAGAPDLGAWVTVVAVTFHSAGVIAESLRSVPAGVRVIVVDNGSRDETVSVVREVRPDAEVFALESNLGFGRASNVGLRLTETPFAFLLNPDCVVEPGALEALLAAAEADPALALVGPAGHGGGETAAKCSVERVVEIGGAAMLLRMDVFRRIGFFDEKLFLFGEDNEICARARDAGHAIGLVHGASVRHAVGKSATVEGYSHALRARLMGQSAAYMTIKRRGPVWGRVLCLRKLVVYAFMGAKHTLAGRPEMRATMKARALGYIDFLAGGEPVLFRNTLALRPRDPGMAPAAAIEKRP